MKILYNAYIDYTDGEGSFEVKFNELEVKRETNHFYFIERYDYKKSQFTERRIAKESKNGTAFDTKEKALFNLLKRRERRQFLLQISIDANTNIIEELRRLTNEE